MSAAIKAAIVERLDALDDYRQTEILDFVEFLASKSRVSAQALEWPQIDPSRDLAQYIGVPAGLPEEGVAFQRQIRDTEWP